MFVFFFFKQKTAYEMRISDWSSDVCSSDLLAHLTDPDHERPAAHGLVVVEPNEVTRLYGRPALEAAPAREPGGRRALLSQDGIEGRVRFHTRALPAPIPEIHARLQAYLAAEGGLILGLVRSGIVRCGIPWRGRSRLRGIRDGRRIPGGAA